jgi:hypothetical protein
VFLYEINNAICDPRAEVLFKVLRCLGKALAKVKQDARIVVIKKDLVAATTSLTSHRKSGSLASDNGNGWLLIS